MLHLFTDDEGATVLKASFDSGIPKSKKITISYNSYVKALDAYLSKEFEALIDIPFDYELSLTQFSRDVYQTLLRTEPGYVISYQQLAKIAGYKNAYRAVGYLMKHNPFALLIPCHRVVLSNGELGNYNGGTSIKLKLVEFERTKLFQLRQSVQVKLQ